MKEMRTLQFPDQDEPYEIVDGYAREQLSKISFTQSDMATNDESDPAYIKNRTHWVERSHVEVMSEQTVAVNGGDIELGELTELIPNSECTVTIDGVSYTCIANYFRYNAYEWYVIGNGELVGESGGDPNLPFGIFIDNEYNFMYYETDASTCTLKIEIIGEVVHKIPEIYLPEKIGIPGEGKFSEVFNNLTENTAKGDYAHVENFKNTASGYASHAEGLQTTASGYGSHSEGCGTLSNGAYTHAEGYGTQASGSNAHAEGEGTVASGKNSHAGGLETIAAGQHQTAIGKYNISDTSSLLIIGKGISSAARENAFVVDSSGGGWFAGDIYVGSTSGINKDEGSKKLQTELVATDDGVGNVTLS